MRTFLAETTKKVKLISIPVSQNWQFGREDIDEMLFMLQVFIHIGYSCIFAVSFAEIEEEGAYTDSEGKKRNPIR